MKLSEVRKNASDGASIFVRRWLPAGRPKAILLVAHGLAEHGGRYERLAAFLAPGGWAVYAPDHRGHGQTAEPGGLGWFASQEGFPRVRDDLHEVALLAASENEGAPLFLLGHSMGSLLAEAYLAAYGRELSGCILSGVLSPMSPLVLVFGRLVAALGSTFKGQKAAARLLHAMSFGANNRDFSPASSPVDWLSRDAAEVEKYLSDPLCGFVASFGLYRDLLSGFGSVYYRGKAFSGLPKSLPLFIAAGAEDPCGGGQGFVPLLSDRFKAAGLQDIETRLYPGARHEILNESNREEVMGDMRNWLEAKLSAIAAAKLSASAGTKTARL